jgi:hypothetical protein
MLLPIGLMASGRQLCMTRLCGRHHAARALVVTNLQYSGIVFSSLYNLVLFDDTIRCRAEPAWLIVASEWRDGVAFARGAERARGRTLKLSLRKRIKAVIADSIRNPWWIAT